jgi:hypothetical protein
MTGWICSTGQRVPSVVTGGGDRGCNHRYTVTDLKLTYSYT